MAAYKTAVEEMHLQCIQMKTQTGLFSRVSAWLEYL